MATVVQAGGPTFLEPVRKLETGQQRDWWLVALMAGLVVVMLVGLAQRVDPQTLPADEQVPAILVD
jgi:hypothetical protein